MVFFLAVTSVDWFRGKLMEGSLLETESYTWPEEALKVFTKYAFG